MGVPVAPPRGHCRVPARLPLPRNASMARSLTGTTRTSRQLAQVRRGMAGGRKWLRAGILLALTLACSACDTVSSVTDSVFGPSNAPAQGQPGFVQGFLGGVVADEPRAALAAREVLSAGGNAADAAVTLGFVLSVTLPSRAGLGGGGACLAYAADKKSANEGVPEAVLFTPVAPASLGANADRPAAVPMLARGLYLLHARYGSPAVRGPDRARRTAGPLRHAGVARPGARHRAGGRPAAGRSERARGVLPGRHAARRGPDAAAAGPRRRRWSRIRVSGVGDLYTGALARRIVQASPLAGGPLALADLSAALPRLAPAIVLPNRRDKVAFLPPPADGGLAAAAAFAALQRDPSALGAAAARALAVAARWRQGGADAQSLLRHRRRCRRRRCRRCPPPPASPRSTRTATRSPARSAWTTCSAPGACCRVSAFCWPHRRPRCRRRCIRRRSPGTRTSTPSAPRSAAPDRRERRWRWRSAC